MLAYTVGGVVEPAVFADSTVELAVREQLGKTRTETLYTNDLWVITDFTVPAQAQTLDDLSLLTHLEHLSITNLPNGSLQNLIDLSELPLPGFKRMPFRCL